MVENLALGDSNTTIQLTSDNSDIADNFTLPISSLNSIAKTDNDNSAIYVHPTYGGYYTWKAVTAGTGTTSMTNTNATSSICPKGWHLPTGGSSSDFNDLKSAYSSSGSALLANPVPGFTGSGTYDGSTNNYYIGDSSYWSSTSSSNSCCAWNMDIGTSYIYPDDTDNKYYAMTARCIKD